MDGHLYLMSGEPAGDVEGGAGVHDGVGDELAGEQDRVVEEAVGVGGARGEIPGAQGVPNEPACLRGRCRHWLVGSAGGEVLRFPHVSSLLSDNPLLSGITSVLG
jgi:hypothetical protein